MCPRDQRPARGHISRGNLSNERQTAAWGLAQDQRGQCSARSISSRSRNSASEKRGLSFRRVRPMSAKCQKRTSASILPEWMACWGGRMRTLLRRSKRISRVRSVNLEPFQGSRPRGPSSQTRQDARSDRETKRPSQPKQSFSCTFACSGFGSLTLALGRN
jgi:hypothetical protein